MLNQKKLDTKILTAINDILNTLTTNGTALLFDIKSQGNPYMRWTKNGIRYQLNITNTQLRYLKSTDGTNWQTIWEK